jgi:hypothetical protein
MAKGNCHAWPGCQVRCGSVGRVGGRGLKLTWALYLCRLSLTSELGGDYDCCIPRLIHSCPLTPPHHFVAMLEIRPFVPARFEFSIINQLVIN